MSNTVVCIALQTAAESKRSFNHSYCCVHRIAHCSRAGEAESTNTVMCNALRTAAEQEKLMQEALRDATLTFLKTLDLNVPACSDLYHKQMKQLKEAYPTHMPVLLEHLRKLDSQVCVCLRERVCVCAFDCVHCLHSSTEKREAHSKHCSPHNKIPLQMHTGAQGATVSQPEGGGH